MMDGEHFVVKNISAEIFRRKDFGGKISAERIRRKADTKTDIHDGRPFYQEP